MKKIVFVIAILIASGCGTRQQHTSDATTEPHTATSHDTAPKNELSERDEALYEKVLRQVTEAEEQLAEMAGELSEKRMASLLAEIRKIKYSYNENLTGEAKAKCEALAKRVAELKEMAQEISQGTMPAVHLARKATLVEQPTAHPFYLKAGDVLRYTIEAESAIGVKVYNADSRKMLRTHNAAVVNDSLVATYSAIYLLSIEPREKGYVSTTIDVVPTDDDGRPRVMTRRVKCQRGEFGAVEMDSLEMINLFKEPRRFTLRGNIKAAFSGTAKSVVPITIPQGTTEIAYSMYITTSEQLANKKDKFIDGMTYAYRKVKIVGIPLYENTRRSRIIDMLLDENRPITEEDAYCNMYVFRSQKDAKAFQEGTKSSANLDYDVDYSMLGTQSCNGVIPTEGNKTIYIGFENERMRYTNYLVVEAVAIRPTKTYYRNEYSIR